MFLTNLRFPMVKTTIGRVAHVEVGKKKETLIKNQSKTEAQDEWPLGIDFWWILMGFGKQVGTQNRIKISISKGIQKEMPKSRHLGSEFWASWMVSGGSVGAGTIAARIFRPPKEGRFCGEGGICGEVSRVEVGRLRRSIRNAVRARRGGGYEKL